MFNILLLFVLGFYILIKGASVLTDGATALAERLNISPWVIGVVIVGIGTSIPEFAIAFASVFNGVDVGLGTIIGSNTFNLLVILGIVALITPFAMQRAWVLRDLTINIAAIFVAAIIAAYPILGEKNFFGITRQEGFLLLGLFAVWMFYLLIRKPPFLERERTAKILTLPFSLLLIGLGIVGVWLGGRWVVQGAEFIAQLLGLSSFLIGLTIVGIGTSLPELVVSLTAALRKNVAIAVGNIVGSNIFDFLGIFGFTAAFRPILIQERPGFDLFITASAASLLFAAAFLGKKYTIERWQGGAFIVLYVAYLIFLFVRG